MLWLCSELAQKKEVLTSVLRTKKKNWEKIFQFFPIQMMEKPGLKAEGWCNLEIIDFDQFLP